MRPISIPFGLIVPLLVLCGLAHAASTAAYVSRSGEVTVRSGDGERTVASIRPGLFETTWQYRGVTAAAGARPEGVIRAAGGNSPVRVKGEVRADGPRLRCRYELTPEGPVSVNSVHVSVNLPVATWVGARFSSPGAPGGTVPAAAGASNLASNLREIVLEKGEARVRVQAEGQPLMLQDNRVFGGGELEIRVGRQSGEGRAWASGQAEVIAFTLELGDAVRVEQEAPITLSAGADWIPLDLKLDITPGSALDLSALNDAPAGKHGWIVARPDGHFGFERGKEPVRFYGVNLCFSANYLEKAEADRLAERLARAGYNTVRIHHFEGDLVDSNARDSLTFRADNLDRLDYLAAALKKRGLYLKTDLFISRPVRAHEAPGDNFKMAVLVSDAAHRNWEAFSEKLLAHRNPYTGLAWKDDPAVAWLCVVNEGNALNYLGSLKGELKDLFEREWRSWLKERYPTDPAVAAAWGDAKATLADPLPTGSNNTPRGRDVAAWVTALHERSFERMKTFLRQKVGTRALLSNLNGWTETPAFMAARSRLDWVDNHFYWDHPSFLERDWQLPSQGGSGGGSAVSAGGAGPDRVSATRLWGKPFSISEYNYSAPNPYRAEGGLLMGAAAALQDWDAVWRFAYSHSREAVCSPQPLNYFDMARDPAGMASEPAAVLLFRRGDLAPASGTALRGSTREDLLAGKADPIPTDRIWSFVLGRQVTDGGKAGITTLSRPAGGAGTLVLESERGVLRLDAPRFAGIAAPAGSTATAGPLTAAVEGARGVVWTASLDSRPLPQSRRLLLVHVTDVQNSGMRYAASDRRVLLDWGRLPHLARAGAARVTLTCEAPERLRAWRLDTSGKRLTPLPVRVQEGKAVLDLTTRGADGKATLYYEIERR